MAQMPESYEIESTGTIIAHRDTLESACDFAKHYSEKGTMMGVQVWRRLGHGDREYICSFVDGRKWDSAVSQ